MGTGVSIFWVIEGGWTFFMGGWGWRKEYFGWGGVGGHFSQVGVGRIAWRYILGDKNLL